MRSSTGTGVQKIDYLQIFLQSMKILNNFQIFPKLENNGGQYSSTLWVFVSNVVFLNQRLSHLSPSKWNRGEVKSKKGKKKHLVQAKL